ncbi:MAG: DUF6020 family protein [Coriobacteriia bacterium]|nr:DUF6020 family protein [Coriobacteriia bacterium]
MDRFIKFKYLIPLFLICWLPFYIIFFPGLFDNDLTDMYNMILGQTSYNDSYRYTGLNDHHTLIYAFFYWIFTVPIKTFGGSDTLIFSVVCFVQLIIVSLCLSYALINFHKIFNNKIATVLCLLFFLINPLIIQYSISHWKDALFGVLVLILVVELIKDKPNLVLMITLLILVSFLRKNGIFVSLVLIIVFIIKEKKLRKYFILCGVAIVVCVIGKSLLPIQHAHFSEAISIPIQQVAYTAKYADLGEEKEFFDSIISSKEVSNVYDPKTPDPIKFSPNFNDEFLDSHKLEFFENYIKLGIAHPHEYFRGWVEQTCTFWMIADTDTWYTLDDQSGHIEVKNFLDNCIDHVNPIYNSGVLILLIVLAFILCKKRRLCLSPLLILFLTLLLCVPAEDFRYVYPLHLSLPFIIMFLYEKVKVCLIGLRTKRLYQQG